MIVVHLDFLALSASLKKSVSAGVGREEYPAGHTQYRHGTPSASMRSEPSIAALHELGIVRKASACITGDLMKCALCTLSHDYSTRLLSRALLNCVMSCHVKSCHGQRGAMPTFQQRRRKFTHFIYMQATS